MRRTDAREGLLLLLAALEELRLLNDASAILRRAVELGRDVIGMSRVRILLYRPGGLMCGTWGIDRSGDLIDEHDLVLAPSDTDRAALRRLEQNGSSFTLFDDCPLLEHDAGALRVIGHGWIAKTPIRSARGAIAMFTNDAGTTGDPADEMKQAHAAILCALLGEMLTPVPRCLFRPAPAGADASQSLPESLVTSVVALLDDDPGLAGKQLAAALNTNLSQLCRVFRILMGMSLVDYRNRLRLRRFEALLDRGGGTLMAAVREAGFGSYSQFHRVFRAHTGAGPREYARRRGRQRPRARPAELYQSLRGRPFHGQTV
jgi:AraC-like DNA-binding protein